MNANIMKTGRAECVLGYPNSVSHNCPYQISKIKTIYW